MDTPAGTKRRFSRPAFEAAMARAGCGDNDSALARRLGVSAATVNRWRWGKSYPEGELLVRLLEALDCTESALGGAPDDAEERDLILRRVRLVFGASEADLLRHLYRLGPQQRAVLVGRVQGWVDACAVQEPPPVTPLDRARDRLIARGRISEGDPTDP